MNDDALAEARYLLRKALTLVGDQLAISRPWVWEGDRWNELVFALLARTTQLGEDTLRFAVDDLSELGLLEIPILAAIGGAGSGPDLSSAHARRIVDFLEETGFSPAEARRGLAAICEAANGLQERYDGKVQRYLRGYGEAMLRDLSSAFQFKSLSESEVKHAFTYWLQNVLNMPLSLADENVQEFCGQYGLTPEQLFAAADDTDVNLALVDDVVLAYQNWRAVSSQETEAASELQQGEGRRSG